MCDPLSVTASVITVAALAVKACESLKHATVRFSQVSKDVNRHMAFIQALQTTLAGIATLNAPQLASIVMPNFHDQLHDCLLDLQAMEKIVSSVATRLEDSQRNRTVARIRWTIGDQRRVLDDHLSRIEAYYQSFSLDLLVLNARLGLHLATALPAQYHFDKQVTVPMDRACPLQNNYDKHTWWEPEEQKNTYLRSSLVRSFEPAGIKVNLRLGCLITAQKNTKFEHREKESTLNHGYGIALATAFGRFASNRYEVSAHIIKRRVTKGMSISFQWNLSWPRIVPYGSRVVGFASIGDIAAMQHEFSTKQFTSLDVLPNGTSLLHIAASCGQLDMIHFLLDHGAQPNATDGYGETPLHAAISLSNNYDVCRVLLDHGADSWNRNADGQTPLHTFFNRLHIRLLQHHEDVLDLSDTDDRGMSLLHYLAWSSRTPIETFRKYYERSSITLRTLDNKGRSVLHLAAERGNIEIVQYLCSTGGAYVGLRDHSGRTALHSGAATKRASQVIQALLATGITFQTVDRKRAFEIQEAADQHDTPALRALLDLDTASLSASHQLSSVPVESVADGTKQAQEICGDLKYYPCSMSHSNRTRSIESLKVLLMQNCSLYWNVRYSIAILLLVIFCFFTLLIIWSLSGGKEMISLLLSIIGDWHSVFCSWSVC